MGDGLTSRRYRKLRTAFRADGATADAPCWICRQAIDYGIAWPDPQSWELDHLYPRSTHPQHAEDPANFRHSHKACNASRGNTLTLANDLGSPSRNWLD